MSNVNKNSVALFLIFIILLIAIAAPLIFIWALNTLFPVLNIAYGFSEWLAALFLLTSFQTKGFRITKSS